GSSRPSNSVWSETSTVVSTWKVSALSRWLNAWRRPDWVETRRGGAARLLDGLPRLGEFDLLGSLRGAQEGDGLALKVAVGHGFLRSSLSLGALPDEQGGMQEM